MFDYLVTAFVYVAGLAIFCAAVAGFVKVIDIFLNTFDDRDPWK